MEEVTERMLLFFVYIYELKAELCRHLTEEGVERARGSPLSLPLKETKHWQCFTLLSRIAIIHMHFLTTHNLSAAGASDCAHLGAVIEGARK